MAALFLLICCSAILLGISVIAIFLGSYLLGRPLSKGCGKPATPNQFSNGVKVCSI